MSFLRHLFDVRRESRPKEFHTRLRTLTGLVSLTLVAVLGRLWVLQVVHGKEYSAQAAGNHLKQREIPAPRGSIYDADGHRIAEVRASFDVAVGPQDVLAEDAPADAMGPWDLPRRLTIDALAARLSEVLPDRPKEAILERWAAQRKLNPWHPVVLVEDLNASELERVLAHRAHLPGAYVVTRHRRYYPDGSLFSHVVGYLREVRSDELVRLKERYRDVSEGEGYYQSGDRVGKWGIEAAHEDWLKGRDGAFWVQVDVHGRELGRSTARDIPGADYFRSIAHFLDQEVKPEEPGHDLHLCIRRDLQLRAAELMVGKSGSVVMLEVSTGRVLALLNAPAFDPDIFSRPLSQEAWKQLSEDPTHPLVDKALQGVYPPGSTWKMIVAAAVLGSHQWTPATVVSCHGATTVGNRRFGCWKRGGHGTVGLHAALRESCDVYFYRAGLAAGIDEVSRWATAFGMGRPTGVGVNSEAGGLNPNTDWKRRRYKGASGTAWSLGDTASAVIGQGYTLSTPMQLARMAATLANGGTVYRPQLVDRVVDAAGRVVWSSAPEVVGRVDLPQSDMDEIRRGMLAVVDEVGGTARKQRLPQLSFAGKTGTAQVVALGRVKNRKQLDHAWFVAFAPFEHPEVALCVLVENGEHGATAAAPIARQLLEAYFQDRMLVAKRRGERIGQPGGSAGPANVRLPAPGRAVVVDR